MRKNRIRLIISVILMLVFSAVLCVGFVLAEGETFFKNVNVTLIDSNGDGKISAADYTELKNELLKKGSGEEINGSDVNGDGKVNGKDFLLYKQKLAYDNDVQMQADAKQYGFDYQLDDGRVLVWHDEFDGDEIDPNKWHFRGTMGGADRNYINDEEHARVENGELLLTATLTPDSDKRYAVSYGVTTDTTMNYYFGYAEIRAKISYRHAGWPSWWMQGPTYYQKAPWWAEIDIYEVFGSPDTLACTLHKHLVPAIEWRSFEQIMNSYPNGEYDYLVGRSGWVSSHQNAAWHGINNKYTFEDSENLNDEYHIYGFLWDDEKMEFSVDGEVYTTFDLTEDGDWDRPYEADPPADMLGIQTERVPGLEGFKDYAYMIFNNEFFTAGNYGTDFAEDEDFPFYYHLDYFRLWQHPESEGIHLTDEISSEAIWQAKEK